MLCSALVFRDDARRCSFPTFFDPFRERDVAISIYFPQLLARNLEYIVPLSPFPHNFALTPFLLFLASSTSRFFSENLLRNSRFIG